jgi:hypothetical protein
MGKTTDCGRQQGGKTGNNWQLKIQCLWCIHMEKNILRIISFEKLILVLLSEPVIFQLPVNLLSFEKKTVISNNWEAVHSSILPFDTESEKNIIECLITDINSKYPCNLATSVNFNRSNGGGRSLMTGPP